MTILIKLAINSFNKESEIDAHHHLSWHLCSAQ